MALVDIPVPWASELAHKLAAMDPERWPDLTQPLGNDGRTGCYEGYFHSSDFVDDLLQWYPFEPWSQRRNYSMPVPQRMALLRDFFEHDDPPSYGIADSVGQVLARWPYIEQTSRRIALLYHWWRPDPEGRDLGFRWHKNGSYIGAQPKRFEYIGEDPEARPVIMFELVEVGGST